MPTVKFRNALALMAGMLLAASGFAQKSQQVVFDHSLTLHSSASLPAHPRPYMSQPETLHVLAAMIAFQEDNDSRTTGTGSFDLSGPMKHETDSPPHNKVYFQQHLTFLNNYYRKASDAKVQIASTVLDSVYRLPHTMQYYSPSRTSSTNRELGLLMQDAWHLVDSLTPGFPFSDYDAFVLFHAGAGRDIDFTSIYGYDPTPFDIPSIFLNIGTLQKMFGGNFAGVPVAGGSFLITNSMIIPESENRLLDVTGGTALLELGINGLLAASMGSYLTLPDLFDTKTGKTGIGRFGLMDGQSIFSWNGLFPPEPSAWEKYYLGWVVPITITSGDTIHQVPAVSLAGSDTIYKVLVNEQEYFLVENRNRDANRDGAIVTMVVNGSTVTRTWVRDSIGFNAFNQDSLSGVILDVDEFDWSLPGGVGTDNEFYDGGILIWHVDERVIAANLAADAVNADPSRRGVNLMEADGSQDIGQSYGFLSAGSGSEDGTPFDFWFANHPAPLRKKVNALAPTSYPSSTSNDGANTHITIGDFPPRSPYMAIRIAVGDTGIMPLAGFPKQVYDSVGTNSLALIDTGRDAASLVIGTRGIFGWKLDGTTLNGFSSTGEIARPEGMTGAKYSQKVAWRNAGSANVPELLAQGLFHTVNVFGIRPAVYAWSLEDKNQDSLADIMFGPMKALPSPATTPVLLMDTLAAVGLQKGSVAFLNRQGDLIGSFRISNTDSSDAVGVSAWDQNFNFVVLTAAGTIARINPFTETSTPGPRKAIGHTLAAPAAVGAFSVRSGNAMVVATRDGSVHLLDADLRELAGFPLSLGGEIHGAPAVADIDGDGQKDIVVCSGNRIIALSAAGVILDHFPITLPTSAAIEASPIVADVTNSGSAAIITVTREGLVVAYAPSGQMVPGFPLPAGRNTGSTPVAFAMQTSCLSCPVEIGLAVAADDGFVYAWKTGSYSSMTGPVPRFPWPQYQRDGANTGLDNSVPGNPVPTASFFPATRAYNWPNPVRAEDGFRTRIRYYVASDARVTIKIFDMTGDLVTDFSGKEFFASGGIDNEVEWDVSGIQSGVYFAHIDAKGTAASGNAVIKIAVVK